ncbi:hypothetical protein PRZ48_011808 [Zasmidium cellare]|uniref:Transmembrane protein n=1 Tax=Zasmidium cellare TaxID=395010 RepID=A0ABR0E7E0_ZASCE|nr:hypothetical protein PRZ48_011808 [Zasmidium cellare]
MGIKAPWKGWLGVAMPIVGCLLLANTIAAFVLALFNAATLDLYHDRPVPEYLATHGVQVRAQLVLFWCVVPFVYVLVSACEYICLWTNRLNPLYVLVSSVVAIGVWILQIVLWSLCTAGSDDIPGYCPWVYREPWGRYPSWSVASPKGAQWAVPTIFILYITQLTLAALVVNRQRRTSFRKSDMRQSWAGKLEQVESQSMLVRSSWPGLSSHPPDAESQFMLARASLNSASPWNSPSLESRSRVVSESAGSEWTRSSLRSEA